MKNFVGTLNSLTSLNKDVQKLRHQICYVEFTDDNRAEIKCSAGAFRTSPIKQIKTEYGEIVLYTKNSRYGFTY